MNLAALLLAVNEWLQVATDYLFVVKLFAALALVYLPMEIFKKSIKREVYKLKAKFGG